MKNLIKNPIIVGISILMLLLLVSCSSPSKQPSNNTTSETQEVVAEQTDQPQTEGTSESQPAASEGPGTEESELPEDLPIMEGSRKLSVTTDGTNVSYEVDGTIDDVVAFYQEELPNFGWEMTRTPDNVLGAMATMARTNEKGDRMTFSLQYNQIAQFVVVRIFISRIP